MINIYITTSIITLLICFYVLMFFFCIQHDPINYKIEKKSELFRSLIILGFFLFILIYIFILLFSRKFLVFDLYSTITEISFLILALTFEEKLLLLLLSILCLFLLFLINHLLYLSIKRNALKLHLYFTQYVKFVLICHEIHNWKINLSLFPLLTVLKYTKNPTILDITRKIWPISAEIVERNIYFLLIPYLIFFDLYLYNGVLSKVFIVLPYFFIYSLLRSFLYFFSACYNIENVLKSHALYDKSS